MFMGILFKARSGNISNSAGLLLIRLGLGTLFLLAGAGKVLHLQDFISSVQETGRMNNTVSFVLAFILPFMEMIFGALYIIGLFTPVTSFFMAVMTLSFLYVLGAGNPELPFSYNIVFLLCFIATMFTGAGMFSFDSFGDRKKKEEKFPDSIEKNPADPRIFDAGKVNESDAIFVDENEVKDKDIKG